MSGFDRRGVWVVPEQMTVLALMGGAELDLRQAKFAAKEVVITINAIMGGATVIVGPRTNVVMEGTGIMGGYSGPSGLVDAELDAELTHRPDPRRRDHGRRQRRAQARGLGTRAAQAGPVDRRTTSRAGTTTDDAEPVAVEQGEHQVARSPRPGPATLLVDRGEPQRLGDGVTVDAHDRQVLGHAQAGLEGALVGARGQLVGEGEDGRRGTSRASSCAIASAPARGP